MLIISKWSNLTLIVQYSNYKFSLNTFSNICTASTLLD